METPGVVEGVLVVLLVDARKVWEPRHERAKNALLRVLLNFENRMAVANTPQVIKKLVRLLDHEIPERRSAAVQVLQSLSSESSVASRIANVDGCLSNLLHCLRLPEANLKGPALWLLWNIAVDRNHREVIAAFPNLVPCLVKLQQGPCKSVGSLVGVKVEDAAVEGVGAHAEKGKQKIEEGVEIVKRKATIEDTKGGEREQSKWKEDEVTEGMTQKGRTREKDGEGVQVDGSDGTLTDGSDRVSADMEAAVVALLGRLALADHKPSVCSRLVELIAKVGVAKRMKHATMKALRLLAADKEHARAVVSALLGALRSESENLQKEAAKVLEKLCSSTEFQKVVTNEPGMVERLGELSVLPGSPGVVREATARALKFLDHADAGNRPIAGGLVGEQEQEPSAEPRVECSMPPVAPSLEVNADQI